MRKGFRSLWIRALISALLFKHEPFLPSLLPLLIPTFFSNHKASVWYASVGPLSLSITNYFGLRRGISVVVSLLQFPRHLHYSCVFVAVCVGDRRESEKVEAAADENRGANSNNNNNVTNITWYQLWPQFYSKNTFKHRWNLFPPRRELKLTKLFPLSVQG